MKKISAKPQYPTPHFEVDAGISFYRFYLGGIATIKGKP
jgi:hypothetical protein